MIPNNWSARCLSFRALQFGLRPCVTICRDVHASNATTATAPSPALESHQTNTIDIFILVIEEIMHQRSHVSGFSRSSATTECGGLAKVSWLFPNDSSKSPTSSTLEILLSTSALPENQTKRSLHHSPHLHLHTALRGQLHQALRWWWWNGRVHRHVLCFENSQNRPVESGTCYV